MKIAFICTGLGNVWRGYERYTNDLFNLIKDDLDIILFKGGGTTSFQERKFLHLKPNSLMAASLSKFGRNPYFFSNMTYALSLLPHLLINHYDIIHYSEPALGNILYRLKQKLGFRYKLLFSNGVGLSPDYCPRSDYLHQLTDDYYQEARERGIPGNRVCNLPYGLHCDQFFKKLDRYALRRQYGIPEDKIIVLSVAALNRTHKRIDYLIRELAKLDPKFYLVVCGNLEDSSLPELANNLLPKRHTLLSVPFAEIPNIYRMADIFVHTALIEGFCLAIVEAMCAELPVVAHHASHFEWLIGSKEWLVDMSKPDELAQKLYSLPERIPELYPKLQVNKEKSIQRFDWKNLKEKYLGMYQNVSLLGNQEIALTQ